MERTRKEERDYWLFSKSDWATFARARNDVPLEEVADATAEEAAEICAEIRNRLAKGDFYELWIKVLVYFNDTSALEILQDCLQRYKEKQRVLKRQGFTFEEEVRLLKEAIKQLNRAAKRDTRA